MGASRFIGRVGGLAVALGVGTALLAGQGVAWADTSSESSSSESSAQGSGPTGADGKAGPAESKFDAGSPDDSLEPPDSVEVPEADDPQSASSPSSSGAESRIDDGGERDGTSLIEDGESEEPGLPLTAELAPDELSEPTLSVLQAHEGSPAVNATSVAAAVEPVAPAGAVNNVINVQLDPPAEQDPAAPTNPPLDLALLALSRREAVGLAGAGAPASAAANSSFVTGSLFGNSIVTDPQVGWVEGILEGTLAATSTRGLPLKYKVISDPSLGGKIFLPGDNVQGRFSYLPYMSTLTSPGRSEQFRILVAETTKFDEALKKIPIVGLLVDPVLDILYRLPIISELLAPIIGSSQIVEFNENPYTLVDGRPVGFTYKMPSFDGVLISVNYFPAVDVALGEVGSAPTVLNGPDLGFPGNIDTESPWAPSLVQLVPGLSPLRNGASPFPGGYVGGGGFNVITWDPRGEWASGGFMQLDNPFFEGRDVSSIISWAASADNVAHSQVATDEGDPYIGMVGGSYGGGIQLAVAGTPDRRVDAIVPGIAWNTLTESLYPSNTFKTVIGSELLLALVGTGARINSQIYTGILTGSLFGWLGESEQALLERSGPAMLSSDIVAASLFIQGTVDILFELDAAITNAELITTADPSVPVKMTWYCGGHGVCLLDQALQDQMGLVNMNDTMMWLDQYVAGNGTPAESIPTFQWYDQTGTHYNSELFPFDPSFNDPTPLSYQGAGGGLLLAPLIGGSGPSKAAVPPAEPTLFSTAFALASGSPAWNALNVAVAPPVGTQIAGAPTVSFTYSGLGTSRAVYAQLVDEATGQVVGNIVTPVPVTLDGRQHAVEIPLADIAYTVYEPSDSMTLQITSSALPYLNFTAWGLINISDVRLDLPTVA